MFRWEYVYILFIIKQIIKEIPSPIFIREIRACVSIGLKFEFAATIMELERWYKYIYSWHLYFSECYYKSFIFELDLSMFIG
jgi:hypothetical protein